MLDYYPLSAATSTASRSIPGLASSFAHDRGHVDSGTPQHTAMQPSTACPTASTVATEQCLSHRAHRATAVQHDTGHPAGNNAHVHAKALVMQAIMAP